MGRALQGDPGQGGELRAALGHEAPCGRLSIPGGAHPGPIYFFFLNQKTRYPLELCLFPSQPQSLQHFL